MVFFERRRRINSNWIANEHYSLWLGTAQVRYIFRFSVQELSQVFISGMLSENKRLW